MIIIPHSTSSGGYNVLTRPSVSQSVSSSVLFLLLAQLLWNRSRISWNFVVMKDLMCRYAFLQEMLIWAFWGAIYIPFFLRLPVTNAWNSHSYSILKQCWSVGYVSLLTLFFNSFGLWRYWRSTRCKETWTFHLNIPDIYPSRCVQLEKKTGTSQGASGNKKVTSQR